MGRFKYTDLRPADHWHRISRVEKSPVATSHSDGYWQHTFNYRMVSSNDGYAEEHASVMDKRFEDRKTWREALIAYAPLFLWSCVIFYLSSNGGSLAETSRFIGPFLQFLFSSADEFLIRTVHGVIRKAAHVTEYAILASLASRAFLKSSINWLSGKCRKHT